MSINQKKKIIYLTSISILFLFLVLGVIVEDPAANTARIVLDDKDLTGSVTPVIIDGRVLVPVRSISEMLEAQVAWDGTDKTVTIIKDGKSVRLRIDSHLIRYFDQSEFFDLCDVTPTIINDRTFVPLRLVSNALGVSVKWDNTSKTVYIDSNQKADYTTFSDMKITSLESGQTINGPVTLRTSLFSDIPVDAVEIRYLLLSKNTSRGAVIMRGSQIEEEYLWKPDPSQNGSQIIVAAVYDNNGDFLAGTAIPVQISLEPGLALTGVTSGQVIDGSISLGVELDFLAYYVKYVITNLDTGKVFVSSERDPMENYAWTPMMEDAGPVSIKAIAYDKKEQQYESQEVEATVLLERELSLKGVPSDGIINSETTLSTIRNFQVTQTEYVMIDTATGIETVLSKIGYGSYKWFPSPESKGEKKLFVRVKDVHGITHISDMVDADIVGDPMIIMEGIGPHQVVTGTTGLKYRSNVPLESVKYILVNTDTGITKTVASSEFTPGSGDTGNWKIHAEGIYGSSEKIISSEISFRTYTGRIYSSVSIIDKSRFIELVSEMALESQKKTGMSAALQIAQSIHETNWGQNIPVDKYSGLISYNLFGIKGAGTAGSVISNTWEEYNGISYRVDDRFRAYSNIRESWSDHKVFLLTKSRYQIFREVMHDSTLGAFALRRAGYATDSRYPFKLINIIKTYDLERFDESGI